MKLAVVVPSERTWMWHRVLVDSLREAHEVEIFIAVSSPYPRALREFLRLERHVAGPVRLAETVQPQSAWPFAASRAALAPSDYDLVIDLAERSSESDTALRLTFDGMDNDLYLFGKLLAGLSPILAVTASGAEIVSSYPAIEDREVLLRALTAVFARMIALVLRTVAWRAGAVRISAVDTDGRQPRRYSASALAQFAAKEIRIKAVRQLVKRTWRENHWLLAMAGEKQRDGFLALESLAPVERPATSYFADPFLYAANGVRYLFAEEFPYDTRRGVIVCAALDAQQKPGPFQRVLERPYHLSYPFVFEHEGAHYMLPETSRNGTVELYRAAEFPGRWEIDTVLMNNIVLADATLLRRAGLWWMFGAVRSFGGSSQDELFAFYSRDLRGPWNAHPHNPLVSDARCARPAGRFLERDGRLFRPAQDCDAGYGAAIVWSEILELTPEVFRERRIARWPGTLAGAYSGLHTYDSLDGVAVIDLKQRRVRKA
jgi:hypothetical protein